MSLKKAGGSPQDETSTYPKTAEDNVYGPNPVSIQLQQIDVKPGVANSGIKSNDDYIYGPNPGLSSQYGRINVRSEGGENSGIIRNEKTEPCKKRLLWVCLAIVLLCALVAAVTIPLLVFLKPDSKASQGTTPVPTTIPAIPTALILPVWTSWTSWTECSVTCDTGFQHRSRSCIDLVQSDTLTCTGDASGSQMCTQSICPVPTPCESSPCQNGGVCSPGGYASFYCYCATGWTGILCENVIHPVWTTWTPWTECSVSCENGVQQRSRQCNDLVQSDSLTCIGQPVETQSCTEANCPDGDSTNPRWSTWSTWTRCDTSCMTESRSRSRVCEDYYPTDQITCGGQNIETEACPVWNCPDCNRIGQTCPPDGTPNSACDACVCPTHTLTGHVTDQRNAPLMDASIAYAGRPYTPLATTDSRGRFSVPGVCAIQQSLIITKARFSTVTAQTRVTDLQTSVLETKLHRLEHPLIIDNPRDKLRLVGESVAFCCTAESDPPPTKFEWFKDGNSIRVQSQTTTESILILNQLTTGDAGIYTCRVQSEGGYVFSDPARLNVTVSAVGCDIQPSKKLIALPPDCVQFDTNLAVYDIGTCGGAPCTGNGIQQTECKDPDDDVVCCQALTTETINILCQGYTLPVSKITSCGCSQCIMTPTQVSGRITSAMSGEALEYIFVYYNSKIVASTDGNGGFNFEIPVQVQRISLTFSDEILKRVLDRTVVIQIQSDSVASFLFKMKPRPPQVSVAASQETHLTVIGSHSDPVAELVLPPLSMYDTAGNQYTGNAMVTMNNVDMRDPAEAETAPGDFSTVNENGERVTLKSFGMFSLDVTDESGDPISIGGKAKIMVNIDIVPGCNITDGVCTTKVWWLNKKTGSWEDLGQLTVSENSNRRRRQTPIFFAGIEVEVSPNQVYNIDDLLQAEQCWAKVIGYDSSQYDSRQTLSNGINEFTVTAIVKDSQDDFFQRSNGDLWATTRYGSGVCVPIACDSSSGLISGQRKYMISLSATFNGKDLLPANSDDSNFALTPLDRTRLQYSIKDAFHIHMEPLVQLLDPQQGPIFPGRDAGKNSVGICSRATTQNKHFQFHRETPDVFCYNFRPSGLNPLTFYPEKNHQLPTTKEMQRYCFIGVTIRTDSPVTVVSTSTVGITSDEYILSDNDPTYYGRRQINIKPSASNNIKACIEFKCEGRIYDNRRVINPKKTDKTNVTIDIQGSNQRCCIRAEQPDFTDNFRLSSVQANHLLPVWFIDEGTRGPLQGVFARSSLQESDECRHQDSPQDVSITNCKDADDNFRFAIDVVCDSNICSA